MRFYEPVPGLFDGLDDAFTMFVLWDALRCFNIIFGLTAAAWYARILFTSPPRDPGWRWRMAALVLLCSWTALSGMQRLNTAPNPLILLADVAIAVAAVGAHRSSSGRAGARQARDARIGHPGPDVRP